jgi:hypothetical protein
VNGEDSGLVLGQTPIYHQQHFQGGPFLGEAARSLQPHLFSPPRKAETEAGSMRLIHIPDETKRRAAAGGSMQHDVLAAYSQRNSQNLHTSFDNCNTTLTPAHAITLATMHTVLDFHLNLKSARSVREPFRVLLSEY